MTTPPYSISSNTTTATSGSHTLTAQAFDAAGNMGSSAPVTVTVTNDTTPPTVAISSPTAGQTVSGVVTMTASAADNVGVTRIDYCICKTARSSPCCPRPSSRSPLARSTPMVLKPLWSEPGGWTAIASIALLPIA